MCSNYTTPGKIAEEISLPCNRDSFTPMFIAVVVKISKLGNQLRCSSVDEWIKIMCYTHTHTHTHTQTHTHKGVLFSHEEEQNCVSCRKIDGTGDHQIK
jgi:hypothetical protein